jgi:hypothetical protein
MIPNTKVSALRRALMSGLLEFLRGTSVRDAAEVLKKELRAAADELAENITDPIGEAAMVGHLIRCATLVRYASSE